MIGADGNGYVLAAAAPAGTDPPNPAFWALVTSNIATGPTGPRSFSLFTLAQLYGTPTIVNNTTAILNNSNDEAYGTSFYSVTNNGLIATFDVPAIDTSDGFYCGFVNGFGDYIYVYISTGNVETWYNGTQFSTTTYDNAPHTFTIYIYQTTVTFYMDGVVLSTGTFDSGATWSIDCGIEGIFGTPYTISNIQGSFLSAGPTGPTGNTGPTGSVLIYANVFDGGNASITYILGPAFDCGNAT